jgi:citrate synthase
VGIPFAELAEQATFEETLYLLWNGSLPTHAELDSFTRELCSPTYRCNGRRPFDALVLTSTAAGTAFSLLVVVLTGRLVVVP